VVAKNTMKDSSGEIPFPTREECYTLMDRHGMLENIVHHSLEVMKVAVYLSEELNKRGQRIDLRLVEAASLLHDLMKTESLRTQEDHAQSGYRVLKELGYERIAKVVRQHIVVTEPGNAEQVSEEEVVNYADKRVRHDQIVSLEDRFRYLRQRYGRGPESLRRLQELEQASFQIEKKIFSILEIRPDDLNHL
jgi:uncharacterized protein